MKVNTSSAQCLKLYTPSVFVVLSHSSDVIISVLFLCSSIGRAVTLRIRIPTKKLFYMCFSLSETLPLKKKKDSLLDDCSLNLACSQRPYAIDFVTHSLHPEFLPQFCSQNIVHVLISRQRRPLDHNVLFFVSFP
jgi:hypothetical protein